MHKTDITISRTMVINVGNYQSIRPTVSLTTHDVLECDLTDTYRKMSELTDALMATESITLLDEMETIKEVGVKEYKSVLLENMPKINEIINNYGKEM